MDKTNNKIEAIACKEAIERAMRRIDSKYVNATPWDMNYPDFMAYLSLENAIRHINKIIENMKG